MASVFLGPADADALRSLFAKAPARPACVPPYLWAMVRGEAKLELLSSLEVRQLAEVTPVVLVRLDFIPSRVLEELRARNRGRSPS